MKQMREHEVRSVEFSNQEVEVQVLGIEKEKGDIQNCIRQYGQCDTLAGTVALKYTQLQCLTHLHANYLNK
jgi:hypothetical protein